MDSLASSVRVRGLLLLLCVIGPLAIFGVTRKKQMRQTDYSRNEVFTASLDRGIPQMVFFGNSMLDTRIDFPRLARILSKDIRMSKGTGPGNWVRSIKEDIIPLKQRPERLFILFGRDRILDPMYPENILEEVKVTVKEAFSDHLLSVRAEMLRKAILFWVTGVEPHEQTHFLSEVNAIFAYENNRPQAAQEVLMQYSPIFTQKSFLERFDELNTEHQLNLCLIQAWGEPLAEILKTNLCYIQLQEENSLPLPWYSDENRLHIKDAYRIRYTDFFAGILKENLQ